MEAGDYRSQTMSLSADTRQNEAVALHDSCTEHKNQRWLHATITEPPKPEQSRVNICGTDSLSSWALRVVSLAVQSKHHKWRWYTYGVTRKKPVWLRSSWRVTPFSFLLQMFSHLAAQKKNNINQTNRWTNNKQIELCLCKPLIPNLHNVSFKFCLSF